MKAYGITAATAASECTEIVFAENATKARQAALGSDALHEAEYIDLRARRLPFCDEYAPGPVPIKVLLDHDWYWFCQCCMRAATKHNKYIIEGDRLWCSQECRDKDAKQQRHAEASSAAPGKDGG